MKNYSPINFNEVNANMPLRFLQYASRLYEFIQSPRDRYLRRLKKIPAPEFYVFYNGEEDYPEKATLRLSDAFMTISENPTLEHPPLDLVVIVTNINYNKGSAILHKCKKNHTRVCTNLWSCMNL